MSDYLYKIGERVQLPDRTVGTVASRAFFYLCLNGVEARNVTYQVNGETYEESELRRPPKRIRSRSTKR
jgi:hypothetical protein